MKFFLIIFFAITAGCATYSDKVQTANHKTRNGETESAIANLNEQLGVSTEGELPKNLKGNRTLLLLERATLLQAIGRYDLAARDMVLIDQHMAWLDVSKSTKDALGKYLYSGNDALYRSPPYERMMLNIVNMTNFLALENFSAAKVEARRFQLLEKFFAKEKEHAITPSVLALGNYLSAVAFEGGRDYSEAARCYGRAFHLGIRDDDIEARLIDLIRVTGRTEREFDSALSGLDTLIVRARDLGPMKPSEYRQTHLDGDVVVLVQTGLAPMKTPKRIPVEKAESIAGAPTQTGGINSVNFPSLDNPRLANVDATISYNSIREKIEAQANIAKEVTRAYYVMTPKLMGAALSRAGTRALAGKGTEGAITAASHSPTGKALGFLAASAVKGSMNANDRPDTRSWTTLPANISVKRLKLPNGPHSVTVESRSKTENRTLQIDDRQIPRLINFSRNR